MRLFHKNEYSGDIIKVVHSDYLHLGLTSTGQTLDYGKSSWKTHAHNKIESNSGVIDIFRSGEKLVSP